MLFSKLRVGKNAFFPFSLKIFAWKNKEISNREKVNFKIFLLLYLKQSCLFYFLDLMSGTEKWKLPVKFLLCNILFVCSANLIPRMLRVRGELFFSVGGYIFAEVFCLHRLEIGRTNCEKRLAEWISWKIYPRCCCTLRQLEVRKYICQKNQ